MWNERQRDGVNLQILWEHGLYNPGGGGGIICCVIMYMYTVIPFNFAAIMIHNITI